MGIENFLSGASDSGAEEDLHEGLFGETVPDSATQATADSHLPVEERRDDAFGKEEKAAEADEDLFAEAGIAEAVCDEQNSAGSRESVAGRKETSDVGKESGAQQKMAAKQEAAERVRKKIERQNEKKCKLFASADHQADTSIADLEKKEGRRATVKEKAEIRADVYDKAAEEKEAELLSGITAESSVEDRRAMELTLKDEEARSLYCDKILPMIKAGRNPEEVRWEIKGQLLSAAKMELQQEGLSGSDRMALRQFIAKLEHPGKDKDTDKFCDRAVSSKQLETHAQSLMLERLREVARLDSENPGPFKDKNGREWESRYELAKAVMEGGYSYDTQEGDDGIGHRKSYPNQLPVQRLSQLDSILNDLGKEERKLGKLNEEYRFFR